MKLQSVTSRYRLLSSILALALMLVALAYSPSPGLAQGEVCDGGCINWSQQNGCTGYLACCAWGPDDYQCWLNGVPVQNY
jgi:hypothetical protein